ncbi:hypothetical protein SPB21_18920 [Leptothoe sp. ISB3NOV94-8A]
MQAAIQLVPFKDRAAKIEQFNTDLKAGKLDISELYYKAVRQREHTKLTNSIPEGLGMGGIAGVALIVMAGSPVGLVLLVAAGIAGSRTYLGFKRWGEFKDAVRENDFTEYLTDQELSELEDLLTNSGKPATPALAQSYAQLIESMDDVVELGDSPLLKLAKQFRGQDTNASDAVVDTLAKTVNELPKDDTAANADAVAIAIHDDTKNTSEPKFIGNPFLKPADTLPKLDPTELIYPPITLVWGGQGSGKTTLANKTIYIAVERGYLVCVADPHYALGDWPGLPVYGKGANYEECDLVMLAILELSNQRYQERVEKGTKEHEFQQLLVVLEEFTDWSDECSNSAEFIKKACKDFRKVGIHVLMVAHNDTIAATGGAKGNKEAFNKSSLQIESFSEMKDVVVNGQATRMLRPIGECNVVAQGKEIGKHLLPDLSNWKPPMDAAIQPLIIDLESLLLPRNDGDFTSKEAKYPDVFSKAINRIESGSVDLKSVCELSSDAIIRVIKFVSNSYRGEEIIPRTVTSNRKNRDAGVGTSDNAKEALDMLVYLKLAHCKSGGDSYLIAD